MSQILTNYSVKKIIVIALLCYYPWWGNAQTDSLNQKYSIPLSTFRDIPSLTIKFAPLALFEPVYNTFEMGLEYKFSPKYSVQGQFGYGNHLTSPYYSTDLGDSPFRTFRLRGEFRFYFKNAHMDKSTRRMLTRNPDFAESETFKDYILENKSQKHGYFALELAYKNTVFFESELLGQNCVDGVCDFQRFTNYERIKNVGMIHFKYGKQKFYGSNFCIDYYVGLGMRLVDIYLSEPGFSGGNIFFNIIDAREPGRFSMYSITAGIKLGYSFSLKKKKL